jgi:uncharacterized repeat protein (TIGR03943 family)
MYRTLQALAFAFLGLFLLSRVWTGKVLLYINQRFVILVFLAGLGFIILAQVVISQRKPGIQTELTKDNAAPVGSRWNLFWVLLPVMVGLVIPARPLGTSALANRGINTRTPLTARIADSQIALSLAPTERSVLDWIRLYGSVENPEGHVGEAVDVTGFVYHDPRLPDDEFMVGRFTITCCVADALALGMVVSWPGVEGLKDNTWVRVRGNFKLSELDGKELPAIQAETIEAVSQPEQPYLFP